MAVVSRSESGNNFNKYQTTWSSSNILYIPPFSTLKLSPLLLEVFNDFTHVNDNSKNLYIVSIILLFLFMRIYQSSIYKDVV
jgi:hypothetical protein